MPLFTENVNNSQGGGGGGDVLLLEIPVTHKFPDGVSYSESETNANTKVYLAYFINNNSFWYEPVGGVSLEDARILASGTSDGEVITFLYQNEDHGSYFVCEFGTDVYIAGNDEIEITGDYTYDSDERTYLIYGSVSITLNWKKYVAPIG